MNKKRLFRREKFKSKEGDEFFVFSPTVKKTDPLSVEVSDKFRRQKRILKGGLDRNFVVPIKRRKIKKL